MNFSDQKLFPPNFTPVETPPLSDCVERHLASYFKAHEPLLPAGGLYGRILCEVEKPLIECCLRATGGNQIKAAALLGLNRNTLRKKIRELGICIVK